MKLGDRIGEDNKKIIVGMNKNKNARGLHLNGNKKGQLEIENKKLIGVNFSGINNYILNAISNKYNLNETNKIKTFEIIEQHLESKFKFVNYYLAEDEILLNEKIDLKQISSFITNCLIDELNLDIDYKIISNILFNILHMFFAFVPNLKKEGLDLEFKRKKIIESGELKIKYNSEPEIDCYIAKLFLNEPIGSFDEVLIATDTMSADTAIEKLYQRLLNNKNG